MPTPRSTSAEVAPGCYTTAHYEAGTVRHARRHARRLRRDARALGLGAPDEEVLCEALARLGRESFGARAGIVRLALRRDPLDASRTRLAGETRSDDAPSQRWRAILFAETHPGAAGILGVKREAVPFYDRARARARHEGVEDALLASDAGLLVEGARTNVFVVRDQSLITPPLRCGAVAGVAREIVLENVPEAREADISMDTLAAATEVVLVNAVRGAVSLDALADRRIGTGEARWAARLRALLLSDPAPSRASPE